MNRSIKSMDPWIQLDIMKPINTNESMEEFYAAR